MINNNVVLISPPPVYTSGIKASLGGSEHLGLSYLASALSIKGVNVHIKNYDEQPLSPLNACDEVLLLSPVLIGISPTSYSIDWALEFSENIKSLINTHIIFGGHLATNTASFIIENHPFVDMICIGDGEQIICEIVEHLTNENLDFSDINNLVYKSKSGEIHTTNMNEKLSDINQIEWPQRNNIKNNAARILTSRGCNFSCDFCTTPVFYNRKVRLRDINDVIDEMIYLNSKYDVRRFFFSDDSFISNSKDSLDRANYFAELLEIKLPDIEFRCEIRADIILDNIPLIKRLYNVGMKYLFVGYESCIDSDLKYYNKNITSSIIDDVPNKLQEIGISVVPGFIMFNNATEIDDVEKNLIFLFKNDYLYRTTFYSRTCMGYPGSGLFNIMKRDNNYDTKRSNDYLLYPKFINNNVRALSIAFERVELLYLDVDSQMLAKVIYIFEGYKLRRKHIDIDKRALYEDVVIKYNEIQNMHYQMCCDAIKFAKTSSEEEIIESVINLFTEKKPVLCHLVKEFTDSCKFLES
jgi:radical SAM superfamily enzyme YgiQ (UPF0313 family)